MYTERIHKACLTLGLLAVVGLSGCSSIHHGESCCSCGPCCPCDPCAASTDVDEGTTAPAPADEEAAPPTPAEAGEYEPAPSPPQEVPSAEATEERLPLPRRMFRSVSRLFSGDNVPPLPTE